MLLRMRHQAARHTMADATVLQRRDPTGTIDIRKRAKAAVELRWRKLKGELRNVLIQQDILGIGTGVRTPLSIALAAMPTEGKSRAFQLWLDQALARVVLENDTAYLDTFITVAYTRAMLRAQRLSRPVVPPGMTDAIHALQQLLLMEMQGIVEAVSQNLVREAANAQLDKAKPAAVLQRMFAAIDRIGVVRSRTAIEVLVIKTHAQGTLDTFELAGVRTVLPVPETVPKPVPLKVRDAAVWPAPARRGTSRTTVGRIRREEERVERRFRAEQVEIQTAGDDLVCPECEELAADGPYSIDEARSLIPAHPNCRCSFVPEDEATL